MSAPTNYRHGQDPTGAARLDDAGAPEEKYP